VRQFSVAPPCLDDRLFTRPYVNEFHRESSERGHPCDDGTVHSSGDEAEPLRGRGRDSPDSSPDLDASDALISVEGDVKYQLGASFVNPRPLPQPKQQRIRGSDNVPPQTLASRHLNLNTEPRVSLQVSLP